MPVIARIEQLRVDAHFVASALHAAFHHMRDAQFLTNLAQVTRQSALVLHYRSAADDFEVGDLCQMRKNFILHTIGEVSVLFVAAQVFKG